MNQNKLYLKFTRDQRKGIVVLLLLMIFTQLFYFLYFSKNPETKPQSAAEKKWMASQLEIDSLKAEKGADKAKIFPFNPNFISDYKGYTLGMSVAEIDRLHKFRETNKYVNSAKEFQQVTKVSDAWLEKHAPFFKFPDWVKNKSKQHSFANYSKQTTDKKAKIAVLDINKATQEDLIKVYGIGPALSERILKEREKLGAFVSMNQMHDIWGLSPEVVANLNKYFAVVVAPNIRKLSINEASVKELSQFPFFKYQLAKEIVTHRSMQGAIKGKDDLMKIKNFPLDKVDIIALYLDFN